MAPDVSRVLHVAPGGNDAWSGRLSAPNAAKSDGPLATPAAARDAVRKLRAGGTLKGGATVQLRGGTYYLAEPLVLAPEDSGAETAPLVIEAYPGEKPVLSGGRRLDKERDFNLYSMGPNVTDDGMKEDDIK